MNKRLSGIATAAVIVLALPAWAQGVTTQGQPTQQNAPDTAGASTQIRADATPVYFREMTAGSLPLSPWRYHCDRTRLVNPPEQRPFHCGRPLSGSALFRRSPGSG
jgi:hypothetical protein